MEDSANLASVNLANAIENLEQDLKRGIDRLMGADKDLMLYLSSEHLQ